MNEQHVYALDKAKELEISINKALSEIKGTNTADGRWLAIATTDLEKGLLALNHSLKKD